MKLLYNLIVSTVLLVLTQSLSGQARTVTGTVFDSSSGDPLIGANILVQGTSIGAITDIDGNFSINVSGEATLVISYIGYDTKEIRVTVDQTRLDIEMAVGVQLGEVVVVALGIKKEERSLGYAVQNLSNDDITNTGTNNVINALQGQVAGVQINRGGGGAGQGSQIFIRGFTSLDPTSDNQPLFVVDGIPIDNSTQESFGRARGMSNRAIDINPADIESISILRSAPATALYGVRAANGAVIITTKQGKAGDVRVDFSSSVGTQQIINWPDYQDVYGPGFGFEPDPNGFWPAWGAPYSQTPDLPYYNNWRNAMRNGFTADNTLSVSGGTETARFYTSISNSSNRGVIPNNDWGRTSVRASGEVTKGKFSLSASTNFINSGGSRVPFINFMERLSYWNNSADVTDWRHDDGTMKADDLIGRGTGRNPIYDAYTNTYKDDVNRFIGNIRTSFELTDGLRVEYLLGIDTYSDERTEIEPGPRGLAQEFVWSAVGGFRDETRINSRDLTSNVSLFFNKQLSDDFNLSVRVGNDVFERTSNLVRALGSNFVVADFSHFSNARDINISQRFTQRRLIGLYGDLNLDYKDIVYLNITGRNDWTSTLIEENRSFFYPSVNLAVVFTELFDAPSWLTYGKLRTSFAEVGKDAPPYSTQNVFFSPAIYPLGDQVGFSRGSTIASADLRPERTVSTELGLDLRFLRNRLGLDITVYKANSRDMIIPVPVSNATSFARFITNAGEIENKGIEITLRAKPVETRDFQWNIASNFTTNRNRVVGIRDGVDAIFLGDIAAYINRPFMQLVPGESYGAIWGTSYARFGDDPSSNVLQRDLPLLIGANGFPVINTRPTIVGDALPRWTANIANRFNYKSWDFSFNIDMVIGVDKYNKLDQWDSAFGHTTKTLNRNDYVVFEGLNAEGVPNTREVWLGQGRDPRDNIDYGAGYHRNIYRVAVEQSVEDASFIKLRSLTLGYSLPQSVIRNTAFRALRASVMVDNILLWTPWTQYDPEAFVSSGSNLIGLVDLAYPGTRNIMFSINCSF
ncbi:MAG TPA: SusC/RagA family TonB-linked outer membrane protein [Saprospiraceae bacterium]|nr:SusC/RagA family TonB-linked outer membrane protein [Saprospiraceae bacterium]